jgi:hypothetical protein
VSIKVCNRQLAGNHLTTELKQNQPLTVPTLSLAGDSDDLTPRRARAGGPGVSQCAAHIVNLIVRDGLQEVDQSIKRVRAAVRYIKNGTSRLVKFKEIAQEENVDRKAFLQGY